jgi:hypothetical protein
LGVLKVGAAQKFLGFVDFESGRKVKKPRKSGQTPSFRKKKWAEEIVLNRTK